MTKFREPASSTLTSDIVTLVRSQLGGRRGLLILAAMTGFTGILFNWSWLVAAGIAPILIAVLPCLVMCGLGLCMNKMTGGSCDSKQPATSAPKADFADVERPQDSSPMENMRQQTSTPAIKINTQG